MINNKLPEMKYLENVDWEEIVCSIGYKSTGDITRIAKPYVSINIPNQETEVTCKKHNGDEIILKFNMYGLCNCKNANNQLYPQPDSSIEMYQEKKCTAINKTFIEKMLNITNNSASKLEYCSFLQLFFDNSIPTHEKECAYYNGLLKQIQIDEKQGYEICDEFVTDVISRLEQHKMMKDGLSEMTRFIDSKIQEISSSTQSEQ